VKVRFDWATDALYVRLEDSNVVGHAEVGPGVFVDYDRQNRVVGFEVLEFRKGLAEACPPRQGRERA
jgi:uncharacterized protein YuzE